MSQFADKLRDSIVDWTGYVVKPAKYVERLEESDQRIAAFADEAEDLALLMMDDMNGRPQEMTAESRRYLARQSRTAFIRDPIAGAEANLRANFAMGRGVPVPQAKDEDVQKTIEEAWNDPNNQRKLTSFEAQRHRSNDLLVNANLYPCFYEANGRVRVGFHNEDLVTDVVMHPEDDETPLWYVVRKRESKWNFEQDRPEFVGPDLAAGLEKVYYIEHWRNVEDAERWAEETGTDAPPRPPQEKILPGKMEHVRINRVGRTQFGIPPWARTLRFYSAMNQLTEAQVQMRQAAATLVAKRVRRAGPRDLMKAAGNVLKTTGELAASKFGTQPVGDSPRATGPGTNPSAAAAPPPAGSWWMENEADRLEAVRLSSGASEAAQDAQIIRAPLAAASGFGPHYLGDPSSVNLATASTLELPTLMEVSAWQEVAEGLLRLFVDQVIEAAVSSGRLGGFVSEGDDDGRPLPSLHLCEDQAEMEQRTGKDLSYSFEMPYPGRRNLPDVVNGVTAMALQFDPAGSNPVFKKLLLDYALRHGFQVENPAEIVDEIMAAEPPPDQQQPPGMQPPGAPSAMPLDPGVWSPRSYQQQSGQVPRDPREQDAQSQYGERRRASTPPEQMAQMREAMTDEDLIGLLRSDTDGVFMALLGDPAGFLAGTPAVNGNGAHPARSG